MFFHPGELLYRFTYGLLHEDLNLEPPIFTAFHISMFRASSIRNKEAQGTDRKQK